MSFSSEYADLAKEGFPQEKREELLNLLSRLPHPSPNEQLQIAHLNKADPTQNTRWRDWPDICHLPWWIENANNRTIARNEVILDVDDGDEAAFREKTTALKAEGLFFVAFKTGSRGYHIHIFSTRAWTNEELKIVRRYFIKKYRADVMKGALRTLISIEGTPHWKTGVKKTVVMINAA